MKRILCSLVVALLVVLGASTDASAAAVRYHGSTRVHVGTRVVPPALPGPTVRGGVTVTHRSAAVAVRPAWVRW